VFIERMLQSAPENLDELVGVEGEGTGFGQGDGFGEIRLNVLGDPAEGVAIRVVFRDPLKVFEVEGVDDFGATGEIGGLDIGLDAAIGAGGPSGGLELTGAV